MSLAVLPLTHWENILNSVRAKTGKSALLVASEVSSEIDSITRGYGDVPTHHYAECGRVIDLIRDFKRTRSNTLVFGAVSDIHVYNGHATYEPRSQASIKHASFALEMVGTMAECDFIANLGDNCWENGLDTDNALTGAQYSINALKPAFDRLVSFNLVGNHDKSDRTQMQYELIGAHNDFDVSASTVIRGFGYKDYTDKKVRVIVLNTCDYLNASGGCALSYEQKDFLMRALDLSAKTDARSWQILLLSHIPLDWNGGDYNYYADLQTILKAYEDGATASITVNSSYAKNETPSNYATYSSGKLVYNYSGKNSAKIIANIHGHVHTNKVSKIANTDIVRVATANACPDLNKSESYPDYGDYSITATEAAKIVKVSGTAKDTSATFYCIDLDEQAIYAYGYGADIDRAIAYSDVPSYTVTYHLTNCTSNNNNVLVFEGDFYKSLFAPIDDANIDRAVVTMGGVDITSSVWDSNDKSVYIDNVIGDVVITVSATAPLWTETISDIAAAIRSVWQVSDGVPVLANSNTEAALGVTTANGTAYTDRESKTVYVMPVKAKACDVEVNVTDGTSCTYRFIGLKKSGSTYATVFTTSKQDSNKHSWTAGAIDNILISIERKDGASWAWSYDDTKIKVTFTNGGAASGGDNGGDEGGDITPTYTNVIDTAGTEDNVRLRSSGETASAGAFASGYFKCKAGDTIRVYIPNGNTASIPSNGMYICLYSDTNGTFVAAYDGGQSQITDKTTNGYTVKVPSSLSGVEYARVAGAPNGAYAGWVVTVNQVIS